MHTTNLKAMQISLLRLFNRPISEVEILDLKRILVKHYSNILQQNILEFENSEQSDVQNFESLLSKKSL